MISLHQATISGAALNLLFCNIFYLQATPFITLTGTGSAARRPGFLAGEHSKSDIGKSTFEFRSFCLTAEASQMEFTARVLMLLMKAKMYGVCGKYEKCVNLHTISRL